MSNRKISELNEALAVSNNDLLVVVQGGSSLKVQKSNLFSIPVEDAFLKGGQNFLTAQQLGSTDGFDLEFIRNSSVVASLVNSAEFSDHFKIGSALVISDSSDLGVLFGNDAQSTLVFRTSNQTGLASDSPNMFLGSGQVDSGQSIGSLYQKFGSISSSFSGEKSDIVDYDTKYIASNIEKTISLETSNNTPTNSSNINLKTAEFAIVKAEIICIDKSTNDQAVFRKSFAVRNIGGSHTIVGNTVQDDFYAADAALASVVAEPKVVTNDLVIEVTGLPSTTLEWSITSHRDNTFGNSSLNFPSF